MTWDPPRPRLRRTQLLTMGATWTGNLDALYKHLQKTLSPYPHDDIS